jgi:hypothetical protein
MQLMLILRSHLRVDLAVVLFFSGLLTEDSSITHFTNVASLVHVLRRLSSLFHLFHTRTVEYTV